MSNRFLNWTTTEKARRFFAGLAGFAAFGAFGAHLVPNSLLLVQYKEFMQTYSSGVAIPVPAKVLQRAKMVLEDCKLPDNNASRCKFFSVVGLDTFHAGSPSLNNGAIIGLPQNFRYDKEEDVDRNLLLVNHKSFDFESPTGKSLLKSIILSERAQKFAIAKEILAADTNYMYAYGGVASLATLIVYSLSNVINTKLSLLHRVSFSSRLVIYTLNTLIGFTLYCLMKDGLNHYFDKEADVAACKLGMEYALGGVEFYEKALERNRALRDALGEKGKRLYTMFGNEEVWIRTKRLPVSVHLDVVKDLVKEMEKTPNVTEQNEL